MKISELARATGVTVPTIKYYVREGLMRPGQQVSATQAEYDQGHAERLRLVRALVEVGGLSLTVVGELLAAVDHAAQDEAPEKKSRTKDDDPRIRIGRAIAAAHHALVPQPPRGMTPIAGVTPPEPVRARAVMDSLGWEVERDSAGLQQLETALAGLDSVGLPGGEPELDPYARAALSMAEAEVRGLPTGSAAEAVRYVVLGTVMYEPVLIALRRLAQEHVFRSTDQKD